MREAFIQATYLVASGLFILSLKGLSSPATARRGIMLAEIGMVLAVVGTLVNHDIVRYDLIIVGLVIGTLIGAPMAIWMPMTAVPQRTAISHMFGALAATLVGVSEYYRFTHGGHLSHTEMTALGFEVMFGALTVTGSLMAFGKLQGMIRGAPITYRGQNLFNIALFFATIALFLYLLVDPDNATVFYTMMALGFVVGILLVMPIGGADMPVVISVIYY